MVRRIYRLTYARQASYGIETDSPTGFETLRESFGEYSLSVEIGRRSPDDPLEEVGAIADDATYEERWNTLARLEGIEITWAEQEAILAEADRLDELDETEGGQ